jgi:hypothetical protein
MKPFRKLSGLILLSIISGVPAMACMAPDAQLTEDEQACCRAMANECGDMDMAAGHSCCQKIIRSQQVAVVTQPASADHAIIHGTFVPVQFTSFPLIAQERSIWLPSERHPPPAAPRTTEILRI